MSGGGYAEYCVALVTQCLPLSPGITLTEAAGIPETFFTVWSNVFMKGKLKADESILIHGGSSGIGMTAIQLATAFGATTFVTAGTEEKCLACEMLGAKGSVNNKKNDFVSEIRKLNRGHDINMILDMVGGQYFNQNLDLLAYEGRIAKIAAQQGELVNLSLKKLMSKCGSIMGSTLRPKSSAQKEIIAREILTNVWPLFESKTIRVVLDRTYPLADIVEAHKRLENGNHIGKVLLSIQQ